MQKVHHRAIFPFPNTHPICILSPKADKPDEVRKKRSSIDIATYLPARGERTISVRQCGSLWHVLMRSCTHPHAILLFVKSKNAVRRLVSTGFMMREL